MEVSLQFSAKARGEVSSFTCDMADACQAHACRRSIYFRRAAALGRWERRESSLHLLLTFDPLATKQGFPTLVLFAVAKWSFPKVLKVQSGTREARFAEQVPENQW